MFLEIRKKLIDISEEDYKKFSEALIPNVENYLGVRLPILKKIAKEIIKSGYSIEYIEYEKPFYFEEIMLQGILIGNIKEDFQIVKKYIENFIPKINNWSVCDTFCTNLKICKKNTREMWKFIEPYFFSEKEYEVRFATVIYLKYLISEEYVDKVFGYFREIKKDKYYIQMGIAWALAETYLKFPEKTFDYLEKEDLDSFTFKKTIQKICDSYRVSKEEKDNLKNLRKKRA